MMGLCAGGVNRLIGRASPSSLQASMSSPRRWGCTARDAWAGTEWSHQKKSYASGIELRICME